MSRPDNSHLVIAAARRRAAATRKRAVTALRHMENAGAPITFDTVAREAHVSRSWLYNQDDPRDRQPEPAVDGPSRRGPATPTATAAFNDDHSDPQPATRVQRLAATTSRGRGHPNQASGSREQTAPRCARVGSRRTTRCRRPRQQRHADKQIRSSHRAMLRTASTTLSSSENPWSKA